ncbi:MAG TPA: hypothetical protein EYG92_04960 [Lutibacter sp.]|nr:hypothetical protein [Lutibacter sp.]
MIRFCTFFTVLLFAFNISAQEISISLANSISARDQFSESYGYQIGYSKLINNKHKLGIKVNHLFSHFSDVEPNHFSTNDGKSYYREEESDNQRFFIATDYLLRIFSKKKSSLFIGPEVNLNYYFYHKNIYQYLHELPDNKQQFEYLSTDTNKLGFGVSLAYYYKIKNNLSIVASIKPEIALFSSGGCLIYINPSPWLHANIGLVYHIQKD